MLTEALGSRARGLRILMLEDVRTDAELIERELRSANLDFESVCVDTEGEFVGRLRSFDPDLILADYSLPTFDGQSALEIAQDQRPEIPFVFVSGAIGEERAIESLQQGATDYVLKDRLGRLGSAVERALREAEEKAARRQAEEALRHSEERHRVLLTINNAIIANLDSSSLFAAVAEVVGGVLPFDLATFLLLDSRREELIVRGLAGVAEPSDGLRVGSSFRLQESHLAPLFNGERTLLLPSLREHGAMADEMRLHRAGLRSVIAVPLERDITIGAFCLGSSKEEAFQPRDAEFLAELGQQIALAVGNMLAYEEIARLKSRLEQENVYLREEIQTEHNFDEIVGASPALKSALKAVETVAPTEATVLVTGETGTGKELIARAIHQLSPRESRPLVKVNCATIPSGLVESELFGHEKGAFTGAMNRKIGRFELADRGTIFLDEVGDLPADLQAKLLRVLQEGEFERVGGSRTFKVNTRVIAATNRDLGSAMEEGQFRPDLYYRLNVFPIHLAPLRERAGDVALLAQHFVQKHSSRMGKRVEILPRKALDALAEYSWPGNVRELENVVERAIITSSGPELELGSWLDRPRRSAVGAAGAGERDASATLDELQRGHIADVLERVGWRVSGERGGARILGLKPTTLEARMKKLGIRRPGA